IFLFYRLLKTYHLERSPERKSELILLGALFGLDVFVMHYAQSSTSMVGMMIGILMILLIGRPFITSRNLGPLLITVVVLIGVAEWMFGIYEVALGLLGKNASLTDRVPLWKEVIAMQPNMLFGAGFENFWMGDRLETLWGRHWWHPIQAHNGYIE